MNHVRSDLPGIEWPAICHGPAANLLALQWQFQRSERAPAEELLSKQFRQLEKLLLHCAEHVPFWKDRLTRVGLPPACPLDWTMWKRLPVLSRDEAQSAGQSLHSTSPPPEHGQVGHTATSGSTGVPLTCLNTEAAQIFWHGLLLREVLWHDWDPASRVAVIRDDPRNVAQPPDGASWPEWGAPVSEIFQTGPIFMLSYQAPIALQAQWLLRCDPDMILSWPSNLAALAYYCLENSIHFPRVKVVRTMGETVSAELRALCRKAWGASVVDSYSSEEAGYIALQCPTGTHYHIQSEAVLVEILDDAGAPVPPGSIGRVVVTPLHNFAMPLLRYEIGDDAEVGLSCTCGRTLPTLARIAGRTRDRLRLPNGERRFYYSPSVAFANLEKIKYYQIAQVTTTQIQVRMVSRAPLSRAEEAGLADALEAALGHCFQTEFVYVDTLPLMSGRKFREVTCEIDD